MSLDTSTNYPSILKYPALQPQSYQRILLFYKPGEMSSHNQRRPANPRKLIFTFPISCPDSAINKENPKQEMKEINSTGAHLPKSLNPEGSAGQMGSSGLQKLISFHVIGQNHQYS